MIASLALLLAFAPATMNWSFALDRGGSSFSFAVDYRRGDTELRYDRSYPMGAFGSTFRGVTKDDLLGNGSVRFDVVRQEGTLACSGTALGGSASGDFTYVLDPAFAGALARRGVTGALSADAQRDWLLEDADVDGLVDALAAVSAPAPSFDLLRRAFDHGVNANYVRSLAAAGVRVGLDEAVRLADHGVTARYLGGLAQNGYHVTPDQAVELADHGVTVHYIEHLRQAGYANLSVSELIELADHGVH